MHMHHQVNLSVNWVTVPTRLQGKASTGCRAQVAAGMICFRHGVASITELQVNRIDDLRP